MNSFSNEAFIFLRLAISASASSSFCSVLFGNSKYSDTGRGLTLEKSILHGAVERGWLQATGILGACLLGGNWWPSIF